MYYRCMRTKLVQVIGYPIIKTGANRKNNIRVMHSSIGLVGAMHAQHTQKLAISCWISTQAHQRIGDWVVKFLCQLG